MSLAYDMHAYSASGTSSRGERCEEGFAYGEYSQSRRKSHGKKKKAYVERRGGEMVVVRRKAVVGVRVREEEVQWVRGRWC